MEGRNNRGMQEGRNGWNAGDKGGGNVENREWMREEREIERGLVGGKQGKEKVRKYEGTSEIGNKKDGKDDKSVVEKLKEEIKEWRN